MKKSLLVVFTAFISVSLYAQPSFTSNDMPNVGDADSLNHNPNFTPSGNLDAETGSNYNWDYSALTFPRNFFAVDSFRQKTHPVSDPFSDATIEYYHHGSSGNNLELYSYSGDTLYTHRSGGTSGGTAFVPPVGSIKFPIPFNGVSYIVDTLYYRNRKIGIRKSSAQYDGYGNLTLPNGEVHKNVFRIKTVVEDTTFSTQFTVKYTNYYWYLQGGDIPVLRIYKVDFNGSNGTIYNVYTRKNAPKNSSVTKLEAPTSISVYPNPTKGLITIDGIKSIQPYTIQDVNGKALQSGNISVGQTIDIHTLANGVYVLQVGKYQPIKIVRD